jgi:hypothetical protein
MAFFLSRYGDIIVFVFVDHVNLPYVRIAYSDPDDGTFFRSVYFLFSIFKYQFNEQSHEKHCTTGPRKKRTHKYTVHTARLDRPESGTTGSMDPSL